jgi:hypothetical protein
MDRGHRQEMRRCLTCVGSYWAGPQLRSSANAPLPSARPAIASDVNVFILGREYGMLFRTGSDVREALRSDS